MKRRKIDHAPSRIKAKKSDMPYSEILKGIDIRLKVLNDSNSVYYTEPKKFAGLILDNNSRIDELESVREWIASQLTLCQYNSWEKSNPPKKTDIKALKTKLNKNE